MTMAGGLGITQRGELRLLEPRNSRHRGSIFLRLVFVALFFVVLPAALLDRAVWSFPIAAAEHAVAVRGHRAGSMKDNTKGRGLFAGPFIRLTFNTVLKNRAYTKDSITELVAQSPFGQAEVRLDPIGFELWLHKWVLTIRRRHERRHSV